MNKKSGKSKILVIGACFALALVVGIAGLVIAGQKGSEYVGAEKCKNCHEAKYKGNQYGKWKEMKHSKAYETLASDDAKKAGEAAGVASAVAVEKRTPPHELPFSAVAANLIKLRTDAEKRAAG